MIPKYHDDFECRRKKENEICTDISKILVTIYKQHLRLQEFHSRFVYQKLCQYLKLP